MIVKVVVVDLVEWFVFGKGVGVFGIFYLVLFGGFVDCIVVVLDCIVVC